MTIEQANRLLISNLTVIYDERESSAISSLVMERITGLSKSMRLIHKTDVIGQELEKMLQNYIVELVNHRPVQYVLNEAWFGSMSFYVDETVLIPRPETEELVDWLLTDCSLNATENTVLDIGTGSGCIPILIKKKRMDVNAMALDISASALTIAKKNAKAQNTEIDFFHCDILDPLQWRRISETDIIISNPPYIPEKQKQQIEKHVRDYEPGLALFVPDDNPIVFYKVIGQYAMQKLKPGGRIYLEIHHDFAKDITKWYQDNGFFLELRKDFSGNNRMIKAGRL